MNRLILPRISIVLIFVVLVGRLYQLQLVDSEANRYRYATQVRTTRYLPVRPMRGEIFASDGKTLLAESVPIFTVSIRPADLPEPGSYQRAAVFAQLSQLLGITTTLTISPAQALEQDAVLRSDLIQGLGPQVVATARQHNRIPPLSIPVAPSQYADAAALAERYRPTVQLAAGGADAPTATFTSTLIISPALSLEQNPALRDDILRQFGPAALAVGSPVPQTWATLEVPPARSMVALRLSQAYSPTLQLANPIAAQVDQANIPGYNLMLTIDVAFQRQVEQILRNWIAEGERRRQNQPDQLAYKRNYKPIQSGVALVMEVHTGRILAMVSWPAYDNNIWDPARAAEWQQLFAPQDEQARKELARLAPLTNRAIAHTYPPGSTIKQFDASIALQKGVITPETKVHDPGKLVVENEYVPGLTYPFPNAGARAYGDITVSDALKVSSNVFFMSVVGGNKDHVVNLKPEQQIIEHGLGIEGLAEGLGWFGFGERTGIKLIGEEPGRVPTPAWKQQVLREAWTTGDTYNAAIGQGNLEVTPLQLLTAAAAVANGGTIYRPQIVQAITASNGATIQTFAPEPVRQVPVDPAYLAIVREGMRRSVTEGVNRAARDDCSGLQIAGKTGTAEFGPPIELPPLNGKPREPVRQSHSWFVGFAPYDNPQIEVLALIEGTGDLGDGSATIAVPAVTQIMQAYFGITPPNPLPRTCQQDLPPLPPRVVPTPMAAPITAGAAVRQEP